MDGNGNPFDLLAEPYDQWYDSPFGAAVFRQEITCLRQICPRCDGAWLEASAGTGRFALALGIAIGLDPSPAMLRLASARGIRAVRGHAEAIPFPDGVFDGVLMVFTLCFLEDPAAALGECRRVLRPGGVLVLGVVPARSAWGLSYARKAAKGHPLYSSATFYTAAETADLATSAGFTLEAAASALLTPPDTPPDPMARPIPSADETAGFVAARWVKPA